MQQKVRRCEERFLRRSNPVFDFKLPCIGIRTTVVEKQPAIYIVANKRNGTLYTGVTSDLVKRIYQHQHATTPGFSHRYGCKLLVYYEMHEEMLDAIAREKQIKAGSRKKKIALIEEMNPEWKDLYTELF